MLAAIIVVVVVAALLILARPLLRAALGAARRRAAGRLGAVPAAWGTALKAGGRTLVAGASRFAGEDSSLYDVIVLDQCTDGLPTNEALAEARRLSGLVAPGGTMLVRVLAALPGSRLGLAAQLLHDALDAATAAFHRRPTQAVQAADLSGALPADFFVESRAAAGWFHEALVIRRRAAAHEPVVEQLRRKYGDSSMAFCTSAGANRIGQPEAGIRYFLCAPDGMSGECVTMRPEIAVGYVAYLEELVLGARLRVVLMDPVCAPEDRHSCLGQFLRDCEAAASPAMFSCISKSWLPTLAAFGMSCTMLGSDLAIRLADYTLSKDRRRYLRIGASRGLVCRPEGPDAAALQALNDAWLGRKVSGSEAGIWTWPPSVPQEQPSEEQCPADEVRRLFTYQDGRLVGFVAAEPYYRNDGSGEVLGYGLNTVRFLPNLSPPWISDFTVATLIHQLQAEGRATHLAFGLSPFHEVQAVEGDTPWLRRLHQLSWSANMESIYPLHGLLRKKEHHCHGQGVRLDDRFVAAIDDTTGLLGFLTAVRFVLLLDFVDPAKLVQALLDGLLAPAVRCLGTAAEWLRRGLALGYRWAAVAAAALGRLPAGLSGGAWPRWAAESCSLLKDGIPAASLSTACSMVGQTTA